MGVMIKGMEMPKSCKDCPCKTADAFGGLGCQATGYIPLMKANQDRPDWCPLVPIPPHGRLIDADELKKESQYGFFPHEDEKIIFESDVDDVPTIIPAEEDE